jgi:ferredoxin
MKGPVQSEALARASYFVAPESCLRCGACSTLTPGVIAMSDAAAIIVRQPVTQEEVIATEAALFNCPVGAIRRRKPQGAPTP